MKRKKHIPIVHEAEFEIVYYLKGYDRHGLTVNHHLNKAEAASEEKFYAHRNDNYSFIILEKGAGSISIDFKRICFAPHDVLFIAPGQIQDDAQHSDECDYWHLAIPTDVMPKEYLAVFENIAPFQTVQNMNPDEFKDCSTILHLLFRHYADTPNTTYHKQLQHELLRAFVCMIAHKYRAGNFTDTNSRPHQLTRDFKTLLKEHITTMKSPTHYAALLHISEVYLNEVVKNTTRFSVGYWIISQTILESKRLLIYTQLNAKEVAYKMGYENQAYFSRLFKRMTGIPPLEFRRKYLK